MSFTLFKKETSQYCPPLRSCLSPQSSQFCNLRKQFINLDFFLKKEITFVFIKYLLYFIKVFYKSIKAKYFIFYELPHFPGNMTVDFVYSHKFCVLIALAYHAGHTPLQIKCFWLTCVFVSLLIPFRVPFTDTGTYLGTESKSSLSTSQLCRCLYHRGLYHRGFVSLWRTTYSLDKSLCCLDGDSHVAPLANNSSRYNPNIVL